MSNDENSNESVESVNESEESNNQVAEEESSNAAGNIVSKILELKESNPKVFFGGIGGLVLVLLIMMMSGGDNKQLPQARIVNLSIGQTYSLKGVNTYDPKATIQLVAVPGSIAAYGESTEKGESKECKNMPQGTQVKLIQIQEAFGKAKFAEVEIMSGECSGRKGWVISTNLN